jgi:hypothetical protein
MHGDAWSTIAGHVAYDGRPDHGWPSLRVGSRVSGTSTVARTTGTRSALSASVYVWVPEGSSVTLSVGGTSAGHPAVEWLADGGLVIGGVSASASLASELRARLVRVEVSASSGTATYRFNYTNPLVSAPEREVSRSYSGTLSTVRVLASAGSQVWTEWFRVGEGETLGSGIIGPSSVPGYTASGPWVVRAQQDLMDAGYPLPEFGADGFYGGEMSTAIQALQSDYGLGVDGILGPESRARLDDKLNADRYPTRTGRAGWGMPVSAT